ncbi:MAG: hypothetical protein ACREJ1_01820 [Candidatus Methylomirabilales bacterium]
MTMVPIGVPGGGVRRRAESRLVVDGPLDIPFFAQGIFHYRLEVFSQLVSKPFRVAHRQTLRGSSSSRSPR